MSVRQMQPVVHPARQYSDVVLNDFLQASKGVVEEQRVALRNLINFWGSIGELSRLPRREDFEPQQILNILPNVFMFDILSANTLRYRLVGSALVDHLPSDPTGKLIKSDEMQECVFGSAKVVRDIVYYQRPAVISGRIAKDKFLSWDTIATAMPLGDEIGNTALVLGVAFVLSATTQTPSALVEHELL